MKGEIVSVNLSSVKHEKKKPAAAARLAEGHGFAGDAHAGPGERQVSLLAQESIERMKETFAARARAGEGQLSCPQVGELLVPGAFAENLTTRGLVLHELPLGVRLRLGTEAVLELTRKGKECHDHCAIFRQLGDCVMPREGVFARVLHGGTVRPGDPIAVEPS